MLEATREDIETFLDQRRTKAGRISTRGRLLLDRTLHSFFEELAIEGGSSPTPTRPRSSFGEAASDLPADRRRGSAGRIGLAVPQMRASCLLAAFAASGGRDRWLEHDDVIETKGLIRVRTGKATRRGSCRYTRRTRCAPGAAMRETDRSSWPVAADFAQPHGRGDISVLQELGIDALASAAHWYATAVYAAVRHPCYPGVWHSDRSTTAGYISYSTWMRCGVAPALPAPRCMERCTQVTFRAHC